MRGTVPPKNVAHVDLHDDLTVEIPARVEVEVLVRAASEAVHTGVSAASIRIDGPIERHRGTTRNVIQGGLRHHLVKGRAREFGGRDTAHEAIDPLHARQGRGIRFAQLLSLPSHGSMGT